MNKGYFVINGIQPETWRHKIVRIIFPRRNCDYPMPEKGDDFQDMLVTTITVKLDWIDLLRLIVSRKLEIRNQIGTQFRVGNHNTKTAFMVLPPWKDKQ